MIQIGNTSIRPISGGKPGLRCVCGQRSATFYVVSISSHRFLLCPICKGNLRETLDREDKQWDGY